MECLEQFPCIELIVTMLDLIRWIWYLWLLRCICLTLQSCLVLRGNVSADVDKAVLAHCVLPFTLGQFERRSSGAETSLDCREAQSR